MANKKTKVILVVYHKVIDSSLEEMGSSLEAKIKQAADNPGNNIEMRVVEAAKMPLWDYENDRVDVIIVTPRTRFRKKEICEKAEPLGIIVQDIDPTAYSMADGEKILGHIMEEAIKQKDKQLQ